MQDKGLKMLRIFFLPPIQTINSATVKLVVDQDPDMGKKAPDMLHF